MTSFKERNILQYASPTTPLERRRMQQTNNDTLILVLQRNKKYFETNNNSITDSYHAFYLPGMSEEPFQVEILNRSHAFPSKKDRFSSLWHSPTKISAIPLKRNSARRMAKISKKQLSSLEKCKQIQKFTRGGFSDVSDCYEICGERTRTNQANSPNR